MKELLIRVTSWVNLQGITLSGKKPIPKGEKLYNSISMTLLR